MADIYALEMPKWGMTMDEGVVGEWLVDEGANVSEGKAVVTAESSKIVGEIEAPADGVLRRVIGKADETYPVGALLGVIADSSVSDAEIDEFVAAHGGGSAQPQPEAEAKPEAKPKQSDSPVKEASGSAGPEPVASRQAAAARPQGGQPARGSAEQDRIPDELVGTDETEVVATPHARKLAAKHSIALARITPSGHGKRVTVKDIQQAVAQAGGRLSFGNDRPRVGVLPVPADDDDVPATPIARRLASEHQINLNGIRPSGRAGRVTRADVLARIALEKPAAAPAAAPAAVAAPTNRSTEVGMSSMRKVIAERLSGSYLDSPHFRVTVHPVIDRLLAIRHEVNDNRQDARLSVNDLLVAAVAKALVAVPEVNAQYSAKDQVITRFEHPDISVAVSTEAGLITPIVRNADRLGLVELSAQLTDLATRAKANRLKPEEYEGGTFTVSNLGMFGVSHFDAIINPPQVAILAVGSAERVFVPGPDGSPQAQTRLPLTLSSDHRVVDGALAARFCKVLRGLLESPGLIFA